MNKRLSPTRGGVFRYGKNAQQICGVSVVKARRFPGGILRSILRRRYLRRNVRICADDSSDCSKGGIMIKRDKKRAPMLEHQKAQPYNNDSISYLI